MSHVPPALLVALTELVPELHLHCAEPRCLLESFGREKDLLRTKRLRAFASSPRKGEEGNLVTITGKALGLPIC